jgi:hypothetical protein
MSHLHVEARALPFGFTRTFLCFTGFWRLKAARRHVSGRVGAPSKEGTTERSATPSRLEIRATGQNGPVNVARVGWLLTVVACLVAVVILALDGYLGYAAVTFAVAVSAAINLS